MDGGDERRPPDGAEHPETSEAPGEQAPMACAPTERQDFVYTEAHRDSLRDGDLVLFRGKGTFSKIILLASRGDYSHVGIILWWGARDTGRLMVVEAHWPGGVRAVPLSTLIREYPGRMDIYRVKPEFRLAPGETPADRAGKPYLDKEKLLGEATALMGKDFAVLDLFRTGWAEVFGWGSPKDADGAEDLFCSEFVSRVLHHAGLDPQRSKRDLETTPTEIARSEFLEKLGTAKHA